MLQPLSTHLFRKLNNRTPVHLAVIHGLWECLDILLKNGGIKYALNVCFKFIKFVAHTVTLELTCATIRALMTAIIMFCFTMGYR